MRPARTHTVIDTLALLGGVGLIAGIVAVVFPAFTPHHHGCGNRQLEDATQVRAIHQAMVVWAESHRDAPSSPGPSAP